MGRTGLPARPQNVFRAIILCRRFATVLSGKTALPRSQALSTISNDQLNIKSTNRIADGPGDPSYGQITMPRRFWTRWLKRLAFVAASVLLLAYAGFCCIWYAYPFPVAQIDQQPVSPLVTDRSGKTLLYLVSETDQWRQPVALEKISPWLIQATLAAEDARFREHRGVDYSAFVRAMCQNVAHAKVVSGASTLTMQVCRQLDRQPRTLSAKLWQVLRAWQLEQLRSKDQILEAYLNLAPYGGNVLGAEAAAQWFYGKHATDLSLGEASLLAGLPQSPNRFRPDRHPNEARIRRQFVLRRMQELGMITASQSTAAAAEPLPTTSTRRTSSAPHAAWLALHKRPLGGRTTIDLTRQQAVESAVAEQVPHWPAGTDAAVCVIEIASSDIVAWVGSADPSDPRDGQVNGGLAKRSPGSALKPFLYAAAFQTRRLGPESRVYDGPLERAGWSPENFDKTFSGEIPAAEALRRSLNVPAILIAEQVGLARCVGTLSAAGVTLPSNAAQRGGLALAVGGIEVNLLDLTSAYAMLGRGGISRRPRLFLDDSSPTEHALDADVCAAVTDILSARHRRPKGWESLPESQLPRCMWKTGTSSGHRDAWALGHNGRYAIGVWVGRFSGAGHVGYVGLEAAEPLLGKLFAAPEFREQQHPCPPASWVVTRPYSLTQPAAAPLRITTPTRGDIFLSAAGPVVINPTTNREADARWFLNGRLVAERRLEPLELNPGRYELRCVDAQGQASAVEFSVQGISQ